MGCSTRRGDAVASWKSTSNGLRLPNSAEKNPGVPPKPGVKPVGSRGRWLEGVNGSVATAIVSRECCSGSSIGGPVGGGRRRTARDRRSKEVSA